MAEAVTHRFPLAEAQKALEAVSRLETVKVCDNAGCLGGSLVARLEVNWPAHMP